MVVAEAEAEAVVARSERLHDAPLASGTTPPESPSNLRDADRRPNPRSPIQGRHQGRRVILAAPRGDRPEQVANLGEQALDGRSGHGLRFGRSRSSGESEHPVLLAQNPVAKIPRVHDSH